MSNEPSWSAPQQQEPLPPGQQNPGYPAAPPTPVGGLEPNIAAMLSYLLFGWIGGVIMYLTQKDREVRFHAAQSILTFGGLTIISWGVGIMNAFAASAGLVMVGSLISMLIGLLSLGLWIFLSIQGYQLKHTKLPIVGDIAEQWAVK